MKSIDNNNQNTDYKGNAAKTPLKLVRVRQQAHKSSFSFGEADSTLGGETPKLFGSFFQDAEQEAPQALSRQEAQALSRQELQQPLLLPGNRLKLKGTRSEWIKRQSSDKHDKKQIDGSLSRQEEPELLSRQEIQKPVLPTALQVMALSAQIKGKNSEIKELKEAIALEQQKQALISEIQERDAEIIQLRQAIQTMTRPKQGTQMSPLPEQMSEGRGNPVLLPEWRNNALYVSGGDRASSVSSNKSSTSNRSSIGNLTFAPQEEVAGAGDVPIEQSSTLPQWPEEEDVKLSKGKRFLSWCKSFGKRRKDSPVQNIQFLGVNPDINNGQGIDHGIPEEVQYRMRQRSEGWSYLPSGSTQNTTTLQGRESVGESIDKEGAGFITKKSLNLLGKVFSPFLKGVIKNNEREDFNRHTVNILQDNEVVEYSYD